MSRAIVVPVIRELARCYQAFARVSDAHVRRMGLTPPQFDIVVTLGNTAGHVVQGTRQPHADHEGNADRRRGPPRGPRASSKRAASPDDGRSTLVRLTPAGESVFRDVFEPHLAYLAPAFESLPECGRKELEKRLRQLREALERKGDELDQRD